MQTQTQTKTSILEANLSQLPMMKHFSKDEIATKVDNFRKGEKGIFWFLKLAALIGVGYLTWTYVLPPESTDGFDRGHDWMCKAKDNKIIAGFVEWHEEDKTPVPEWCPVKTEK